MSYILWKYSLLTCSISNGFVTFWIYWTQNKFDSVQLMCEVTVNKALYEQYLKDELSS